MIPVFPGCRSRSVSILIGCLVLLAAVSAIWPVYRAFLNIEIIGNEGWNAYYDDAAMGSAPLYPSPRLLITNNYPPLSFYIVGAFGRLTGDTILAGRLLSLAAVGVIGAAVALAIKRLGGNTAAATIGAAYFVATMCRFFTIYVGMNDPHLLGLAVMTMAFVAFLRAMDRDRGYAGPILLMVAAGFIKHTLIVLPLVSMVWLGIQRPRQMVKCGLLAGCAIVVGFVICFAAYGPDFFTNLTTPRIYSWKHAVGATGHLQWVVVGLLAWLYVGFTRRKNPEVRLCSLIIVFALVIFFVQKTGEGVSYNAEFELVFGVSIAVGLAFTQVPFLPLARRFSPDALCFALLLAICLRLAVSTRLESVRVFTDRGFRAEIATREAAMAAMISRIKATPGDVACSFYAGYRAGKPMAVDFFNVRERMLKGKLPADAISSRLANGKLTIVNIDPITNWSFESSVASYPGGK